MLHRKYEATKQSPSCERKDARFDPCDGPLSLCDGPSVTAPHAAVNECVSSVTAEQHEGIIINKWCMTIYSWPTPTTTSLTANQVCGTRHEALGLIWFRFCGSQFHAVAVSNELECSVWLNLVACAVLIVSAISPIPQRQSLFLHLWQLGLTNGGIRGHGNLSLCLFFFVPRLEPELWFSMYQLVNVSYSYVGERRGGVNNDCPFEGWWCYFFWFVLFGCNSLIKKTKKQVTICC